MNAHGVTVLRREDRRLLRGQGSFIDGLRHPALEGAYHAAFLRSSEPHARILAVNTDQALAIDGVVAVFTAADMDPLALRLRNVVAADAFPYTTAVGSTYDGGRYGEALQRCAAAAGYEARRAEQVAQGHETTFATLVSNELGIDASRIEVVHSDTDLVPFGGGTTRTTSFADYGVISAAETPSFITEEMETPSPWNPLGVKGVGESGTVVATPALQSAVLDALAPYGVVHLDLPFSPERVWRAMQPEV